MSPKVRAYIYGLATPVGALLVYYGVLSTEEVQLWAALVGTALLTGVGGLAAVNTNPKDTK